MKKKAGFTLIELLIVIVIIGILAAISVIGYNAAIKNTRNTLQTPRLAQYVEAQNKFRTILGKRRYGTFSELCREGLFSDAVVKMNASCDTQTAINGWVIAPGNEDASFLRHNFFAVLKFEARPSGETMPVVCGGADGVIRRAAAGTPDDCTISSDPYQP